MSDGNLSDDKLKALVTSRIAERFIPAHYVVQAYLDTIYAYPRNSTIFKQLGQALQQQNASLTSDGLSTAIREAMLAARRDQKIIEQHGVPLWNASPAPRVDVVVEPLPGNPGAPLLLIMLDEIHADITSSISDDETTSDMASDSHAHQLAQMREQLQRHVRLYERMIEKLRSSYEKLHLVRQELAVSKQMLQVLNKQLSETNSELGSKISDVESHEMGDASVTTPIAILLLDHNLMIRSFSSAMNTLFWSKPVEKGRSFEDYLFHLPDGNGILEDVHSVISSGVAIGRKIDGGSDGIQYRVQILPHRNANGRLDGSLVVFLDTLQT
ncbi:MAG: PAS domain-containing protein [Alphaproteobacteria bacterium]|nr:PAS domain-containing protein [Alphaproteobacteria bacterium]